VQLLPDPATPGRLKAGTLEPVVSIRDIELPAAFAGKPSSFKKGAAKQRVKRAVATCRVGRQGLWLVAQFDADELKGDEALSKEVSTAVNKASGLYQLVPGEFTEEPAPVNKKGESRGVRGMLGVD